MNKLLVRLLLPVLVLGALLAWWYPEPALVGIEVTDWAQQYERSFTPPAHRIGAMAATRDLLQRRQPSVPLPLYMENQAGERWIEADASDDREQWSAVLGEMADRDRVFVQPAQWIPNWPRQVESLPGFLMLRDGHEVHFLTLQRWPPWDLGRARVPADLRYPLRSQWPLMLLAIGVVAAWRIQQGRSRPATAQAADSTAGTVLASILMMAVVGIALLLLPHVYGIWGGDIGLPMMASLLGIVLLLSALIVSPLYIGQFRRLQRLLHGEERLVHWTYSPEEWRDHVRAQYGEQRQLARANLWFLGATIVVVTVILVVFIDRDAAGFMVASAAGLVALLTFVAIVMPRLTRRRLARGPYEAHIGEDLLYLGGQTHFWSGWTSRFESIQAVGGPRPRLEIVYSDLRVSNPKTVSMHRVGVHLNIPIPAGREAEARAIAQQLRQRWETRAHESKTQG